MGSLQLIFIDTSYHELPGSFCYVLCHPCYYLHYGAQIFKQATWVLLWRCCFKVCCWLCRKRLQHSMQWNLWNLWHNLFLHLQPSDQCLLLSHNGCCYNNNSRSYNNNNRSYNNNDCSNNNNYGCSNNNNRGNNNNYSSLYCNRKSLLEHY